MRTPYKTAARIKGLRGGVDCATLLAEVYASVGVIDPVELPYYSPQWHLHRSSERYLSYFLERAKEIEGPPGLGDIVVYKFGRAFAHGAIVVTIGWPEMDVIHAEMESGCVRQTRSDEGRLGNRPRRFFSPWG